MQPAPPPNPVTVPRRRRWMACAALLVAAGSLAPVMAARSSGAAGTSSGVSSPTGATTVTEAVDAAEITAGAADDAAALGAEAAAAGTAAAAGDTATTAARDNATVTTPAATTTTAPASSSSTTVAAATRSAAAVAPTQLAQVEAIADTSGFDWRAAGVTFHIAYHPEACCHWGIYDYRDNSLWIGPSAFASSARLRYVVLHELAHAWHWATGRRSQLAADMAPWGYSGNEALEYSADCIATTWGATTSNYWTCPAAAQSLVTRRLSGDWS